MFFQRINIKNVATTSDSYHSDDGQKASTRKRWGLSLIATIDENRNNIIKGDYHNDRQMARSKVSSNGVSHVTKEIEGMRSILPVGESPR